MGLQSMRLRRTGLDRSNLACTHQKNTSDDITLVIWSLLYFLISSLNLSRVDGHGMKPGHPISCGILGGFFFPSRSSLFFLDFSNPHYNVLEASTSSGWEWHGEGCWEKGKSLGFKQ